MKKIIKNTTNTGILVQDTGTYIDANSSYEIDNQTYLLWAASESIISLIQSGDVVVNNGNTDLSAIEAIKFLEYPDRITVKANSTTATRVTTELNFTGDVAVSGSSDGIANINIGVFNVLREVVLVQLGGSLFMNIESNALFEPDPVNDTIKLLREQ
jgi:hypothetical protein